MNQLPKNTTPINLKKYVEITKELEPILEEEELYRAINDLNDYERKIMLLTLVTVKTKKIDNVLDYLGYTED